jgi:serine/threonine-protein kinase
MESAAHDPLIGAVLGKDYRVLQVLGRGGMAVVYLVEHQTLRKQFAAKVLSAELTANHEARARFSQEAHASSQLDHENIVTISDFGETPDHRPYFVMELLRGESLDRRIVAGPVSLEEVVAIAIPVAQALGHAHAEGIVHRDIKPENIFLVQRSQGRWGVKVVDFGIAKAPLNNNLTKMGQVLGSPMFMSPEACRGDVVDHRADLYALGITLFLMMCGRVPYEDPSLLRVLQLHLTAPLPPPRALNPSLSPELAAVVEKLLAKSPDERYQSAADFIDAFEAALPPGADRLLREAQRGSVMRVTPYPGGRDATGPNPILAGLPGGLAPTPPPLAGPFAGRTPSSAALTGRGPSSSAIPTQVLPNATPMPPGLSLPPPPSAYAGAAPSYTAVPQYALPATPATPTAGARGRSRAPMIILALLIVVFAAFGIILAVKRLGGTGGGEGSGGKVASTDPAGSATTTPPDPAGSGSSAATIKPTDATGSNTGSAGSATTATAGSAATTPAGSAATTPAGSAATTPAGSAATTPADTANPSAGKIKVKITGAPAGSDVYLGTEKVGQTPLDLEIERQEMQVELKISHDGYVTATRQVDLHGDVTDDTALVAIKKPTTAPNIAKHPDGKHPDGKRPDGVKPGDKPPEHKTDPGLDIRMTR